MGNARAVRPPLGLTNLQAAPWSPCRKPYTFESAASTSVATTEDDVRLS